MKLQILWRNHFTFFRPSLATPGLQQVHFPAFSFLRSLRRSPRREGVPVLHMARWQATYGRGKKVGRKPRSLAEE